MNERETYQIYKALLGEDHDRTKESAQVLKHLTEQAVLLQKKMNEMYKGEKVAFPPIQIQQPSLQTVLAMLNIINGIIFIPSHEEELDRLREEIARFQQNGAIALNSANSAMNAAASALASTKNEQQQEQPAAKINAQDDDLQ